jgi:hypothetical protein
MNPLSKKMSLVRYGLVLIAMCAVAIGFRGLKLTSLIGIILFALISLKYPLFDGLVRRAHRSWSTFKVLPWLWVGYALAAVVDIGATWVTMSDEGGASFALWVTVLITPCILTGAFGLMVIHTWIARKRNHHRVS